MISSLSTRIFALVFIALLGLGLNSCSILKPGTDTDVTVLEPNTELNEVIEEPEEVILTPVDSLPEPIDETIGKRLKIAILLPFSLDEKSLADLKRRDTQKRNRPLIGLSFYEGVLIALDSLRSLGIDMDLLVFDTKNSADRVNLITRKPEFRDIDLILGPVFEREVDAAAKFARENSIPIVSPFLAPQTVTNDPTFYAVHPGDELLCRKMAEYARIHHRDARFYIIRSEDPKEIAAAEQIRNGLGKVLGGDSLEIIATDYKMEGVPDTLFYSLPSVFFVPSRDEIFVNSASRALATLSTNHEVTVFGLESWTRFQSIPPDYFEKMNLHFATSYWIDQYSEYDGFEKTYRANYYGPPNEYAYLGYDVMLYFSQIINTFGATFSEHLLQNPKFSGMNNSFMFRLGELSSLGEILSTEQSKIARSYINQNARIIQYSDYRFEEVR